jgi:hypothetical protein
MPIISVPKTEIQKSMLQPAQWYQGCTVIAFENKMSKDNKSVNYIFKVEISNHPSKKVYDAQFNSKAIGMMVPFVTAVTGEDIDPNNVSDIEIDTDNYIGKKLDMEIHHETYEGRILDKPCNFLPNGKSAGMMSM